MCNKIAKKPTLYCNQHQEQLQKQILNTNNKEKICSGLTTKNLPCQSIQTGEINNKWYCYAHKSQAPKAVIVTVEPEETEETDEEDNLIDKNKMSNLMPVLKVETFEFFKKISCNGKFSKKELCDLVKFGMDDSSSWLCPLHDHTNKITKTTEIIEVEMKETKPKPKPTEDESIIIVQINTKEDKPKTEQTIQINSELKTIEPQSKILVKKYHFFLI